MDQNPSSDSEFLFNAKVEKFTVKLNEMLETQANRIRLPNIGSYRREEEKKNRDRQPICDSILEHTFTANSFFFCLYVDLVALLEKLQTI